MSVKKKRGVRMTVATLSPRLKRERLSAVAANEAEQVILTIGRKKIPMISLENDENGNIILDRERHPDIYDWLVNG